jgi:hypothetical protein
MIIQCPAGREGAGDPAGVKRRGGSRSPRKASDWSGNQRASFIVQKQQYIRKEPFNKIRLLRKKERKTDNENF